MAIFLSAEVIKNLEDLPFFFFFFYTKKIMLTVISEVCFSVNF